MCLGVPGRVIEVREFTATVDFWGVRKDVRLDIVDEPVALSGGCFANARLTSSILDGLRPNARVFMNRDVPPGDGGIALGQVFIADAKLRAAAVEKESLACA